MPLENPPIEIDVRLLVRWLGPQAAAAGLEKSKRCTVEILAKMGDAIGLALPKSATRQYMIDAIVRAANKRIGKPLEELLRLSRDELVGYLESVDPEREELLDLLKRIDAHPTKEGRRGLIEFAARELSETGRFMRIAGSGHRDAATEPQVKGE